MVKEEALRLDAMVGDAISMIEVKRRDELMKILASNAFS